MEQVPNKNLTGMLHFVTRRQFWECGEQACGGDEGVQAHARGDGAAAHRDQLHRHSAHADSREHL